MTKHWIRWIQVRRVFSPRRRVGSLTDHCGRPHLKFRNWHIHSASAFNINIGDFGPECFAASNMRWNVRRSRVHHVHRRIHEQEVKLNYYYYSVSLAFLHGAKRTTFTNNETQSLLNNTFRILRSLVAYLHYASESFSSLLNGMQDARCWGEAQHRDHRCHRMANICAERSVPNIVMMAFECESQWTRVHHGAHSSTSLHDIPCCASLLNSTSVTCLFHPKWK